jgi:GNAT superfamily N-acetyltransferase
LWQDQIAAWFEREFRWPMERTAPADWRVLATAGEDLVGHVGLVLREAAVGGEALLLVGIGAVIVPPAWRGRGVGRAMLARALDYARAETRAACGLLICQDHRLSFYRESGWQEVVGPLTFTNWQGVRETCGHHVLVMPLREGRAWPAGEIDLGGLPW